VVFAIILPQRPPNDDRKNPNIEPIPILSDIKSLRDARKELFNRFNCDDTSDEYKREFLALTRRYESETF
jgi:hypothetical protein